MPFELVLRDPSHLEAHRKEFSLGLERSLEFARDALAARRPEVGKWEVFALRCPEVVGTGGLKRLWPWTRGAYWAKREGRSIPSHLIRSRRRILAHPGPSDLPTEPPRDAGRVHLHLRPGIG